MLLFLAIWGNQKQASEGKTCCKIYTLEGLRALEIFTLQTTHSYECLQAAHEGSSKAQAEEDFSYIRLESHENNIIAKRYSHAVLGAALEHGWEVR